MADQKDTFQQAMNNGHSAAWDQNWERAAAYYRAALAESPENPQALTSLGLALVELQQFEEALYCYQKAAKALPDDPLPMEKIAQLCERMGNLELAAQAALRAAELYFQKKDALKAIENWERVTRLDPENVQAHSRLALVFDRMGEKSRAVNEYLASAAALQASGNAEKARQAIEMALKTMPGNQDAQQYLNMLKDYKPLPRPTRPHGGTAPLRMSQVRQLRTPQADQSDQDPISQSAQNALTILAGMLFEVDDGSQASIDRKDFQAIMTGRSGGLVQPQDRNRVMLHLSQVVDLQTRSEFGPAAEELQKAIDIGLEHPAAYFDLGFLLAKAGRLESAIRNLQHSVNNADFAFGSRLLLGELLDRKGQLGEASLEYLQALKLADVRIAESENSAQSDELRQLYELLIESHRQQSNAQVQERLCANIHDMLMRADWQTQIRRARQQMPGYREEGPMIPLAEVLTEASSSQVIESAASIYDLMNKGQLQTAMEEAYFTLSLAPTYLPMHSLMGDLLVKEGDLDRAVAKLEVVTRTYAARGESQQAIRFGRKVVQISPVDIGARSKLIELLRNAGELEESIEEYIQLAEVYYSLADLGMARKTYMEAFKVAQQGSLDPAVKIRLLKRAADIDMQSLEWRQAMRLLEQIRTLQPEDGETRSQIIRLNFRLGQEQQALSELDNFSAYLISSHRHKELTAFIDGLLADYPESIPLRRRLADAHATAGAIGEAVSQLDAIGEMLLQSGDRAGAMQTIEAIIALSPPNKSDYILLLDQMRREGMK